MANFPWALADVWQGFKWTPNATHNHSGMDLGMPCGSQLTAPVNSTVISDGQEAWGGQVNLLVPPGGMPAGYDQTSPYVISYLHMSRIDVLPGMNVQPGQDLGLSGQPPPGYGSGCHLHFEVTHGANPPYMGYSPWTPTATSYPQNPALFLASLGNTAMGPFLLGSGNGQTGQGPGQPGAGVGVGQPGNAGGQMGTLTAANFPPGSALAALASSGATAQVCGQGFQSATIGPFTFCVPITVYRWFTQPIRILKIVTATIIMIIVGMLLIVPAIGPTATEVAGVATGQPELVAVGANIKKYQKEKKAQRAAARGKPTAPVGGGINTDELAYQRAQSTQRQNNARRAAATRNFAAEEAARASQSSPPPGAQRPGARQQRRHAGTTSEKAKYDEAYQQRPSGIAVPRTAKAPQASSEELHEIEFQKRRSNIASQIARFKTMPEGPAKEARRGTIQQAIADLRQWEAAYSGTKTAQASKAPPTPPAIAVPPPLPPAERGKPTGLTHPPNILSWVPQGTRGVLTLFRRGKQQPGPLVPPPVQQKRAEQYKGIDETLRDLRGEK